MDILRVAGQVYPEAPGGGAYHVHAMSRDQAAQGHNVTVLTISEDTPKEETRDGYKIIRIEPTVELLRNEFSVGVAQELRDADKYEIIHAHSHLRFSSNLAALARRLGGNSTPLAVTNHGLYSQSVPFWFSKLYLRTIGRWTFNAADIVFTYTSEERETLTQIGVQSDVAVVSNGIDHSRFAPIGSTFDGIDSSVSSVLFVGRLFDGKRPKDVIDAIADVRDRHPEVKLYVCGDGSLRGELEKHVSSLGMINRVEFLGHLSYDQMPSLYRSVDLVVLPSETEGFPRVVLESLATETPVITTDIPQISSLVNQTGRTISIGDVTGLAEHISELLDAPDKRTNLGQRGRELVKEQYSWDETVSGTTEELMNLIESDN